MTCPSSDSYWARHELLRLANPMTNVNSQIPFAQGDRPQWAIPLRADQPGKVDRAHGVERSVHPARNHCEGSGAQSWRDSRPGRCEGDTAKKRNDPAQASSGPRWNWVRPRADANNPEPFTTKVCDWRSRWHHLFHNSPLRDENYSRTRESRPGVAALYPGV
jgi:hypothetical protein